MLSIHLSRGVLLLTCGLGSGLDSRLAETNGAIDCGQPCESRMVQCRIEFSGRDVVCRHYHHEVLLRSVTDAGMLPSGWKEIVASEKADVEDRVRIVTAIANTRVSCIEHLP